MSPPRRKRGERLLLVHGRAMCPTSARIWQVWVCPQFHRITPGGNTHICLLQQMWPDVGLRWSGHDECLVGPEEVQGKDKWRRGREQ